MSVSGTRPVRSNAAWLSSPGTLRTIDSPGLKPSLRFHSVGSIGVPLEFRGIESTEKLTRRPVGVERSRTVK